MRTSGHTKMYYVDRGVVLVPDRDKYRWWVKWANQETQYSTSEFDTSVEAEEVLTESLEE